VKETQHIACGFSYAVVDQNQTVVRQFTYRGKEAVKVFLDHMIEIEKWILNQFANPEDLRLSAEEELEFQRATICYLCTKPFDPDLKGDKCRDHCHITGKFRGAAHRKCNLYYHLTKRIPVLFHNFSGYDSHLIIKEMHSTFKDKKLSCIAQNHEKFIALQADNLVFLDTLRFLPASLDSLVANIAKEGE